MPKTITSYSLYRDDRGKLRKTKSGHYRFDIITELEDGTPLFSALGFRLDYDRKRILPITTQIAGNLYTVSEIAPDSHQGLAKKLCDLITEELKEERRRAEAN